MLQKLEKDMILMQIQHGEAFQVWVVEGPEEDVDFEGDVVGDAAGFGVEIKSITKVSYEIVETILLSFNFTLFLGNRLILCFFDNTFDQGSHSALFL